MKKIDIPEYYRQFQTPAAEPPQEEANSEEASLRKQETQPVKKPQQKQEPSKPAAAVQTKDKTLLFRGNCFTINQLADWEDKTLYTLLGPVEDGIQHNVIIDIEKDPPFGSVEEFADWHIRTLESELQSCMLLKRGGIKLSNGTDAYEAVFSWYPSDETRIYQQQIFVLVDRIAWKLTASYTKKTRKTLGPQIERMMLSLIPCTQGN
jgi:hypothetical protein